jgi:hypothetical protein
LRGRCGRLFQSWRSRYMRSTSRLTMATAGAAAVAITNGPDDHPRWRASHLCRSQ